MGKHLCLLVGARHRRIGIVAVLVAMIMATTATQAFAVTSNSATVQRVSAPDRRIAVVERAIASTPSGARLPAADRAALAATFATAAQTMKDRSSTPSSAAQPAWSIGLGWSIYFHHLSPVDQRFLSQAGVVVIAALVCTAAEFNAAVCTWAGAIASVLCIAISEYYSPTYCLEVKIGYNGVMQQAYRTRC